MRKNTYFLFLSEAICARLIATCPETHCACNSRQPSASSLLGTENSPRAVNHNTDYHICATIFLYYLINFSTGIERIGRVLGHLCIKSRRCNIFIQGPNYLFLFWCGRGHLPTHDTHKVYECLRPECKSFPVHLPRTFRSVSEKLTFHIFFL